MSRIFIALLLATAWLDARAQSASVPAAQTLVENNPPFPISDELRNLIKEREAASPDELKARPDHFARLDKLLAERVAEWGRLDPNGRFSERMRVCEIWRGLKTIDERTNFIWNLQLGGFTNDAAIDIYLAPRNEPQLKKEIWITLCLLGIPQDTVRRVDGTGESVMWVWPEFFVHTKDAIVVSWSDR